MPCYFLGSALQLLKNFLPLNDYLLTVPMIKLLGPVFWRPDISRCPEDPASKSLPIWGVYGNSTKPRFARALTLCFAFYAFVELFLINYCF